MATTFEIGVRADLAERLETAAAAYEASLAHEPTLETILSLATLYWESMDHGVIRHLALPHEFELLSGTRIEPLIAEGLERFPASTEMAYWAAYMGATELGKGDLSIQRCKAWLVEEPNVLAPAMSIFTRTGEVECRHEAGLLLQQARAHPIARNRYVISMLSSHFPSVVN